MRYLLITAALALSSTAMADYADGKVEKIKFFNSGSEQRPGTYIYIDTLPKACGHGHKRISLLGSNPSHDAVLSAALAAKMSGATVRVTYKTTCNDQGISWDFQDFTIF